VRRIRPGVLLRILTTLGLSSRPLKV
jgi:hypothetical protein